MALRKLFFPQHASLGRYRKPLIEGIFVSGSQNSISGKKYELGISGGTGWSTASRRRSGEIWWQKETLSRRSLGVAMVFWMHPFRSSVKVACAVFRSNKIKFSFKKTSMFRKFQIFLPALLWLTACLRHLSLDTRLEPGNYLFPGAVRERKNRLALRTNVLVWSSGSSFAQGGNSPSEFPKWLRGNLLRTNEWVSQRPKWLTAELMMWLSRQQLWFFLGMKYPPCTLANGLRNSPKHRGQRKSWCLCLSCQPCRPFLALVSCKWLQHTVRTWGSSRWPPSGGKKQCFSFGCKQPISFVEIKLGTCLLLDKFTEVGLRQHLVQNSGVGLLMNEEMEDTLRHIHSERDCSTLCGLFDSDSFDSFPWWADMPKTQQPVAKWSVSSHDNCSIRGRKGEAPSASPRSDIVLWCTATSGVSHTAQYLESSRSQIWNMPSIWWPTSSNSARK